jgi:hypothetical protein
MFLNPKPKKIFAKNLRRYVAPQQIVEYTTQIEKNVSHNLQKENTMLISDFEKQYKNYEQVIERIKQVNEFWIDVIVSSLKNFQK